MRLEPEQPGSLPKRLEEGESVTVWLPLSNLLKGAEIERMKRVYCEDGTGRFHFREVDRKVLEELGRLTQLAGSA